MNGALDRHWPDFHDVWMKFYNKLDEDMTVEVYNQGDGSELVPRWTHEVSGHDSASYLPSEGDALQYKAKIKAGGQEHSVEHLHDEGQWVKVVYENPGPGVITLSWEIKSGRDSES